MLLSLALLSACSLGQESTQQGAGLGVGLAAGTATGNPLIGLAAGVIASWSASTAWGVYEQQQTEALQAAIARATGDAKPGEVIGWAGGGKYGNVELVREFGEVTRCREIIFTLEDPAEPKALVVTVCNRDGTWNWAGSQPRADLEGLF
ncbi:MAG: hypothetical protein ACFCVH_14610 [Alphaproteobacteria bacterium]